MKIKGNVTIETTEEHALQEVFISVQRNPRILLSLVHALFSEYKILEEDAKFLAQFLSNTYGMKHLMKKYKTDKPTPREDAVSKNYLDREKKKTTSGRIDL